VSHSIPNIPSVLNVPQANNAGDCYKNFIVIYLAKNKRRKLTANKLFTPIHALPLPLLPHPPIPPAHGLGGGSVLQVPLINQVGHVRVKIKRKWAVGCRSGNSVHGRNPPKNKVKRSG